MMVAALALATKLPMAAWIVYQGKSGPGHGKSVVLLTGDEEYRSEEGLPQLAKILAFRLGFKCTVLFSLNQHGEIDPQTTGNEPGLEALDSADLCIMLLRFRCWPDAQMKHFVDYYRSGRPIIGLRTSTHAFNYPAGSDSPYRDFSWQSSAWPGGFGKQVLGETWVSHWGDHGHQATRGVIGDPTSPILRGVSEIFVTTDVYEAAPPSGAHVLVRGQVLSGMSPTDPPATNRKKTAAGVDQGVNDPMMPVVWTMKTGVLTATMGAATDLLNPGVRRLLVNGALWAVGREKAIKPELDVRLVGDYRPSNFGFDGFKRGVKPSELRSDGL